MTATRWFVRGCDVGYSPELSDESTTRAPVEQGGEPALDLHTRHLPPLEPALAGPIPAAIKRRYGNGREWLRPRGWLRPDCDPLHRFACRCGEGCRGGDRMGRQQANLGIGEIARIGAVALGCLMLADCSSPFARRDANYSQRVVEDGEPVPKGGGTYRVGRPYNINGRTYVPAENPSGPRLAN